LALNECSDVVLAVTVDRGLAEATHIGIGGDGLILGHLITHLHHDVSTCQALLAPKTGRFMSAIWKKMSYTFRIIRIITDMPF